jgi:lathosterol oxidase
MNLDAFIKSLTYGEVYLLSTGLFLVLFLSLCLPAFYIWVLRRDLWKTVGAVKYRPHQFQNELLRSLQSIFIFGFIAIFVFFGERHGFWKLRSEFHGSQFAVELLLLFLWNEIHFYSVHRLFHLPLLFQKFHYVHHLSSTPTPFSVFSFHWTEALLLGTVMPTALLWHDFSVWSLLCLPVMSLTLNILGHSAIDFFPNLKMSHLLSFSRRHSVHHQNPNCSYGFFLPYPDQAFKTAAKENV